LHAEDDDSTRSKQTPSQEFGELRDMRYPLIQIKAGLTAVENARYSCAQHSNSSHNQVLLGSNSQILVNSWNGKLNMLPAQVHNAQLLLSARKA
jgi:hypothetical protein